MIKSILKAVYFFGRSLALHLMPRMGGRSIPGDPRSILIVRLDRIGDMVLTTPLFKALKHRFPGAAVHVLAKEKILDLIRSDPSIDAVIPYLGFAASVRSLRGKYDVVIDPLMDYGLVTALLSRLLRPGLSIGFDIRDRGRLFTHPVAFSDEHRHFVDHLTNLARPLGIEVDLKDWSPEIFVSDAGRAERTAWYSEQGIPDGTQIIAVHPGGFYPSQRWPAEYFGDLISRLHTDHPDMPIVLLGTASEKAIMLRIMAVRIVNEKTRVIPVSDRSLSLAVALIANARLFIGNNSGLVHVAAALDVPTLSTLGPTVVWMWHPYGDPARNRYLSADKPCSPCARGTCRDHTCLKDISVERMYRAAKELLAL